MRALLAAYLVLRLCAPAAGDESVQDPAETGRRLSDLNRTVKSYPPRLQDAQTWIQSAESHAWNLAPAAKGQGRSEAPDVMDLGKAREELRSVRGELGDIKQDIDAALADPNASGSRNDWMKLRQFAGDMDRSAAGLEAQSASLDARLQALRAGGNAGSRPARQDPRSAGSASTLPAASSRHPLPLPPPSDETAPRPGAGLDRADVPLPRDPRDPYVLAAHQIRDGRLTPAQQEALVKSLPMGDMIWRMGADDLWKKGLTGEGVKIAVIDNGVGHHPDLDGAVKSRASLVGGNGEGVHGTAVASVLHALAPDGEIRSYQVGQGRQLMGAPYASAIDKAVADGNHIVNMSFQAANADLRQFSALPTYADRGVLFVGAAGNDQRAAAAEGLAAPARFPGVMAVGALDERDRMAGYSRYGGRKGLVVLAPGSSLVAAPDAGDYQGRYIPNYGTSFAAPAVSARLAQLLPLAQSRSVEEGRNDPMRLFTMMPNAYDLGVINPVVASRRVQQLLLNSGRELPREDLPEDAPPNQHFIAVQP